MLLPFERTCPVAPPGVLKMLPSSTEADFSSGLDTEASGRTGTLAWDSDLPELFTLGAVLPAPLAAVVAGFRQRRSSDDLSEVGSQMRLSLQGGLPSLALQQMSCKPPHRGG
jgi:hypothetical protein